MRRLSVQLVVALATTWLLPAVASGDDAKSEQGDIEPKPEIDTSDKTSPNTSETSENKDLDGPDAQWFRHAGIGFRAGGSFREKATSRDFPAGYALGPELYLAVWSYCIHRVLVGAGYSYLEDERNKGTEQIRVETGYQRIDMFAGYGIAWKLLTAGIRVGTALTIVDVTTTYGEPSWEVVGTGDQAELVFIPNENPDVSDERGVSPGFLGGIGVGLAIGHYLFDIDDLIELRAQADYVRRDERDEFGVYGLLVFWPTRLIR